MVFFVRIHFYGDFLMKSERSEPPVSRARTVAQAFLTQFAIDLLRPGCEVKVKSESESEVMEIWSFNFYYFKICFRGGPT